MLKDNGEEGASANLEATFDGGRTQGGYEKLSSHQQWSSEKCFRCNTGNPRSIG